jgi:hypothetical protein
MAFGIVLESTRAQAASESVSPQSLAGDWENKVTYYRPTLANNAEVDGSSAEWAIGQLFHTMFNQMGYCDTLVAPLVIYRGIRSFYAA